MLAHQGLGDHLVCNALYRELSYRYKKIVIPVRQQYLKTIQMMLSDVSNILLLPIFDSFPYKQQRVLAALLQNTSIQILRLGRFDPNFFYRTNIRLDEYYYLQMSVPHNLRWKKFEYTRDVTRENLLFERLVGSNNEPYVFLHEDASRDFIVQRKYLEDIPRVITPNLKLGFKIFDYRKIIENASAIHCIESSFSAFIDSIQVNTKTLVAHRYARPEARDDFCHEFSYRSEWQVINQ